MLVATGEWLIIYFLLALNIGFYGRVSTLSVYSGIIDVNNQESRWIKFRNEALRLFCLMDAFGLADTNKTWKKCKFIQFTLIVVSGILFVALWPVTRSGLLWFMGVVQLFYYASNVLLTTKPRGLHYLWRSDMVALELADDIDHDGKEDFTELKGTSIDAKKLKDEVISRKKSLGRHAEQMTLNKHQLRQLMGRHTTKINILKNFNEYEEDDDEDSNANNGAADARSGLLQDVDNEERALIAGAEDKKGNGMVYR